MDSSIKVSVICLAYNHEKYIRDTLEGFVMQKANFKFEVLIHDDASTDNTAAIIKEYEEKYPDIIKPIYQTENQYSKGIGISRQILLPLARGKYLAWCEGDDYWTNPNKLQKQIDFLDKNPEYSACVHCATYNNLINGEKNIFPIIKKDRDYSPKQTIMGDGGLFATNSLVVRTEVFSSMPKCFIAKEFGDYQWFVYSSIQGKLRCLKENMSQYNYGVPGSWSATNVYNPEKLIVHYKTLINMLNNVNEFYDYKYNSPITRFIRQKEYAICKLTNNKKECLNPKYVLCWLDDIKNYGIAFKRKLVKLFR